MPDAERQFSSSESLDSSSAQSRFPEE